MTEFETSEIDHLVASEEYRFKTFESLTIFPLITRRQLVLAGFIYRETECICPCCGVKINFNEINENIEYESNYFRKLHREKISFLGKRCPFLLCESGTNINNLHEQLSSQQQLQWDDAEEPKYVNYSTRLQSFENWSFFENQDQQTFVTKEALAKHGFYFSGPNDGVTCFYCGNTLIGWSTVFNSKNENIVQLEHARFFPCRFINYTAGGKFVANAGYFHTVTAQERRERNPMSILPVTKSENKKPENIDECLLTFKNWPRYAPVSADALANTGFYYLQEGLKVKCFMCGLEVDDWRHGMTAIGTHRRRTNDCEIIRAIDTIKTGDIQSVNEKWRLETLQRLTLVENALNETNQRLCRELAACGFFRFKNTKIIRCAYCGVTIEPKLGQSIMSQHRYLTKQSVRKAITTTNDQQQGITIDCLMVRAQCPANTVIPDRERFPEYPMFQSIFDRIKSFEKNKQRRKLTDSSIRDMAEAGFFLDDQKHIRCFQCGNSFPINDRTRSEKYPQYTMAQLHAHFYPTCEWVKEILGVKYIAQVLHDRYKSNEPQTQISFNAQSSSTSTQTTTTTDSSASATTTPASLDILSPTSSVNMFDEPILSQSEDSTDDEGFETVAAPPTTFSIGGIPQVRSPPPSAPVYESSTTEKAQTCSDPITSNGQYQLTSPMSCHTNPFKQLVLQQNLQQQKSDHTDGTTSLDGNTPEMSPSIVTSPAISSPVYVLALLSHESHRLETFKSQNRLTFGDVDAKFLAYVGFFLKPEGTQICCPWCEVTLTEQQFKSILDIKPTVTRSVVVSQEKWTPMRVHRHANGVTMDQNHPWCTWVRREAGGLYPNVAMLESQMLYSEYPSYERIEKRIQSFTDDWLYPSGSRLSNQMMAQAGFFYMGDGGVCCFYCGNKLQKFEPRDCPFEEHATFYPLCDYIQYIRGLDYVNRILLECGRTPQGRLKYEMDGPRKIKRIIFDKSGVTKRKSERPPVSRINSSLSQSSNRSIQLPETIDNACLICSEKTATHEYDPCQHIPMCGECFARLNPEQLQKCMHCYQPATIRMRIPNTPLP